MDIKQAKFIKIGAAAVLSIGLLSACSDDSDDGDNDDIIIDDPIQKDVDPESDTDLDMDDDDSDED